MKIAHPMTCSCCADLRVGHFDRRLFLKLTGAGLVAFRLPLEAISAAPPKADVKIILSGGLASS
jgi:hypothetical protein